MSNTEPTASPIQVAMASDPSPQVCFSDHARLEFRKQKQESILAREADGVQGDFSNWVGALCEFLNSSSNFVNRTRRSRGNLISLQGNQMEAYSLAWLSSKGWFYSQKRGTGCNRWSAGTCGTWLKCHLQLVRAGATKTFAYIHERFYGTIRDEVEWPLKHPQSITANS